MSGRKTPAVIAYVALGSNIGDRAAYLREAVRRLTGDREIELLAASSVYETEPVGYVDQEAFLNQVIALRTALPAAQLLQAMLQIEIGLGRTREIRWGPRTIDLDLLLYGEERIDTADLTVPHPRMEERAFVLVPLVEAMEQVEPARSEAFRRKLELLDGKAGVALWKERG